MRPLAAVAALVAATSAAIACSSSSSTSPGGGGGGGGGHSTTIAASSTTTGGSYGSGGNYYFSPTPDTVASGTSVTFTFGSVEHNVVFDTGPTAIATIPLATNTSVARTFAPAGTYTFHCTIHGFSGTLVAQ